MKLREDDDLEFVDLDDEGYDLPGETEDDEDEQFDEELDERLSLIHI